MHVVALKLLQLLLREGRPTRALRAVAGMRLVHLSDLLGIPDPFAP